MAATGIDGDATWQVIRSRPKSEHLAAAALQRMDGVEAYCPRLSIRKITRRGPVHFIEALFPGYFFGRFTMETRSRAVEAAPRVTGILRFGAVAPTLPEEMIAQLREVFPDNAPRAMHAADSPTVGDTVEIMTGSLTGLNALVTRLLPGGDRARILLEWMGGPREVDLSLQAIRREKSS